MWLPQQSQNLFPLELVRNLLTIFLRCTMGRNYNKRCLSMMFAVGFSLLLEIALEYLLRQRTLDRTGVSSWEKKGAIIYGAQLALRWSTQMGLTRTASAGPNVPSLHIVDIVGCVKCREPHFSRGRLPWSRFSVRSLVHLLPPQPLHHCEQRQSSAIQLDEACHSGSRQKSWRMTSPWLKSLPWRRTHIRTQVLP